jgi:hypothetical protein
MAKLESTNLDMLLDRYVTSLKVKLEEFLQSSDATDLPVDLEFIRQTERITSKLSAMESNVEIKEKVNLELFVDLAKILVQLDESILKWYSLHKNSIIKFEEKDEDSKEEQESPNEDLQLEKSEFSFAPLISQLVV